MLLTNDATLKYIYNIKLPRDKGSKSYKEFIEEELSKYLIDLQDIIKNPNKTLSTDFYTKLTNIYPIICKEVECINSTLMAYDDANYITAYQTLNSILDDLNQNVEYVYELNMDNYYRLCVLGPNEKVDRKRLFHIPFNKRHLANTSRFSLPGSPSLYLSSAPMLCWYESNLPNNFYMVGFEYSKPLTTLKLFDFATAPQKLALNIDTCIVNNKTDALDNFWVKKLIGFISYYPLRLASSIIATNKTPGYTPEYIIPQMILSWIKHNTNYLGIKYHTVSKHRESYDNYGYNVVLPIKNLIEEGEGEGYCKSLANMFKISEPRHFTLKDFLLSHNKRSKINEMYSYVKNNLNDFDTNLLEIEKLLFTLIKIYDDLLTDDNTKNDTLLAALDTIYIAFDEILTRFKIYLDTPNKESPFLTLLSKHYQVSYNFKTDVLAELYRHSFVNLYNYVDFQYLFPEK